MDEKMKKRNFRFSDNTEKKQRTGMERRLANLKPFKPGQSGNPKGRPKGSISLTSQIKKLLEKIVKTQDGTEKQRLEILAGNIISKAINEGNEAMIKLIWNYVDGMPTHSIKREGSRPIIKVMYYGNRRKPENAENNETMSNEEKNHRGERGVM